MDKFIYTPDEDVRMHEDGTIRLLCAPFQSHEDGMPEWLKNAADAYAREDAPEPKRVIIIIFNSGLEGYKPSISCLDFSGMTSTMIEENLRIWADPEASGVTERPFSIQGGHGSGGKCYMTQMFEDHSMIYALKNGKGNRYGVGIGSIRFGYIPNRELGRDFQVSNLNIELEKALDPLRCPLNIIQEPTGEALRLADGFTLVTGVSPKGFSSYIPTRQIRHLIQNLQEHTQMIRTLEFCKIYIVINGALFNQGRSLEIPEITPMEGAEQPKIIPIPNILKDPVSEEEVSTTNSNTLPLGNLVLLTSNKSMRWSRKGRHTINYRARSGYIGYVGVSELDIQSPYRDRIYGECCLEALEPFKQNIRARLAPSPLSRAVERFISEQIQAYARQFEARDRRRYDQEEKNALSIMNEALDRWKNRLLKELMHGLWGAGEGSGRSSESVLPTAKPSRLELNLVHNRAGVGIAFRPILKFFDDEGRRIRPVPFRWISEDNNVAMVNEDLRIINTFAYGQTYIYAETVDGKIESNRGPLEVVRVHEIQITPSQIEIPAGSRHKLDAVCRLANGEKTSSIYLEWTENNVRVARVSSSGMVFGFDIGETEVVAGDDRIISKNPALIKVLPSEGRGVGDQRGRGYPKILISGVDTDPVTKEEVNFSPEYPPIWQRPQDYDMNVWWINSDAPLARKYLDSNRGYGSQSQAWRMYHLERYIEVLIQIALTHGPSEKESLNINDWISQYGEQAALIQPTAAASLSEFIDTGTLPME